MTLKKRVSKFMGVKKPELLSTKNAKIFKSNAISQEFLSLIMHLAPFDSACSGKSVCPYASEACIRACLVTSGNGYQPNVVYSRKHRTRMFWEDRSLFIEWLTSEVARVKKYADGKGKILALRLNGTSDLSWEKLTPQLFTDNPDTVFYDYTKGFNRMASYLNDAMPKNYWLTFSRTETNDKQCKKVLALGGNVAIVFKNGMPSTWLGHEVVDGTVDDLRFLDGKGKIVGLKALGRASNDPFGFTIDLSKQLSIAA